MLLLEAGLRRHGQVQGPTAPGPAVIRLKDSFDGRTADRVLTKRDARLSAEEGRGDVVHRGGFNETLQQGEVAQEELLEHVTVRLRCHGGIGATSFQRQHLLDVPQWLEQVKHVVALLVEKLAHKRGARPGGGQQKDVFPAPPHHPLVLAEVLQAPLHQREGRVHLAD